MGAGYSVHVISAYEVRVESDEFSLRIVNSDNFLNQDVSIGRSLQMKIGEYKQAVKSHHTAKITELEATLPHGILGQTWSTRTYPNRWKFIAGQLFDYVEDGLFTTSSKYSRWINK